MRVFRSLKDPTIFTTENNMVVFKRDIKSQGVYTKTEETVPSLDGYTMCGLIGTPTQPNIWYQDEYSIINVAEYVVPIAIKEFWDSKK